MLSRAALEADAVVTECRAGRVVGARLANGHRFMAWWPRGAEASLALLKPGDAIRVRFSACDLSKARVVLNTFGTTAKT